MMVKMRCIDVRGYSGVTYGQVYEGTLYGNWFDFQDDDGGELGLPSDVFQPVVEEASAKPLIRTFETGATRNLDHNKIDYEGFLSPTALHAFGEYMHGKRVQADGTLRASDNWQRGISVESYVQSMLRHMMDVWLLHRGHNPKQPETGEPVDKVEALCALLFNVQGLLHETLKEKVSE
jgi:hypothetical protein